MVTPTEAARLATRELFERTRVFVVTLRLAEVWFQRRRPPPAAAPAAALQQGGRARIHGLRARDELNGQVLRPRIERRTFTHRLARTLPP